MYMYFYIALIGLIIGAAAQSTPDISQYVLTSVSLYRIRFKSLPNVFF